MAIKLCEKYDNLNPVERLTLVGEIVHSLQVDDEIYDEVQKLIRKAVLKGLFVGVAINPELPKNDTNE